ncbi:hypothetical protein LZC95_37225 [Pendulispora brunnea]|uniref:Uncharacterized protein n=1 Tax=Pendulispora brunnea TaxID=2905690 RepID=A0ABZ2K008_9BACT
MSDDKLRDLMGALLKAIDPEKLERELLAVLSREEPRTDEGGAPAAGRLVGQLAMVDLLDESILGAQVGDKSYPLRVFFATLGTSLSSGEHEETAFPLACAFGLYFRVPMDEESKMRIGLEASRLYYRFIEAAGLEGRLQISPLLASLMNGELEHVRFESVDHQTIFDSQFHERAQGAAATGARIVAPQSFLCRVGANGLVRVRAEVRT